MFDARLGGPLRAVLDPPARRLAAAGVPADGLTWTGFAFGLAAATAIAAGWYGTGLLLFMANRLLDGLDGAVARRVGPTDRGGFLDITLDFVVYAAIPLAFAVADPARNALAASFLLFAFMGTSASFLAFAAVAAQRGPVTGRHGPKTIHYLGGLAEGTETVVAFALFMLLPRHFPWLAAAFGAMCVLTAIGRVSAGLRAFGRKKRPSAGADGPS